MNRFKNILGWLVITLIVLLCILNTLLIVYLNKEREAYTNRAVETVLKSLPKQPLDGVNGKDGYTPIKGVDYFDGKQGEKGEKGDAGEKGKDGVDGVNGSDGLTPITRCNETKNRWEVRYEGTESWRVLGSEPVRCTIKLEDILKSLGE